MRDLRPSIVEIEDNLAKNLGVDNLCVRWLLGEYKEAQARIAELEGVVARVQNADVRMVAWEADDDLVTVNGKPVGATLSRRFRGSIQDVWTSIRDELLAPDAALAAKENEE